MRRWISKGRVILEPNDIRFGGGAATSVLHPLVALALLVSIALIFLLPRRQVVVPWLATIVLVPFGQVIVLFGIHFTIYRILVIAGLARTAGTRLPRKIPRLAGGFNRIDGYFILCTVAGCVVFSLQWMQGQAVIKELGSLLDAAGGYVVLRFLLRDREDLQRVVRVFAFVSVVMAVCMVNEQVTRRNVFGLLGGIPSVPAVREGRVRSQGAFEVYITAGVFGATALPLIIWLWSYTRSRAIAYWGILGASVMVATSNSSTPLLAYAAGIAGLCLWPLRHWTRTFRWTFALTLVGLHLVMKAPVWALIARVDLTGSSSGYQRYMLVDTCIRHFSDWWLIGARYYNTWGWDMWDLSNQYVADAFTGGLLTLGLFIAVISRSFGWLGSARRRAGDRRTKWLLWCLGSAVLGHTVAYFGIGYFDQIQVAWYALLAMIPVACLETVRRPIGKDSEALLTISAAEGAETWGALEMKP
jgi:hypothetical protein